MYGIARIVSAKPVRVSVLHKDFFPKGWHYLEEAGTLLVVTYTACQCSGVSMRWQYGERSPLKLQHVGLCLHESFQSTRGESPQLWAISAQVDSCIASCQARPAISKSSGWAGSLVR